ncbi:hydrogenase large subunit [Anaeromyxobacter oryzae]|uniref:Hydrogenase n=1 Tax=Anaeromyxobacter oryzae TaxID=2918170 RepID=A0ABM7WSU9_9BACT|nr:hydrogenase [Anaeromyxobacter oryzae]BDG02560.1 hydrogenase [Anaeromyxobacter oryzae]
MTTLLVPVKDLGAEPREFFASLHARLEGGARAVTFYGQPSEDPARLELTAVLEEKGRRLSATRTAIPREKGFHALTRDFPALHVFEREIFEQHGVKPHDHPWLKPVRFPGAGAERIAEYPFYSIEGAQVHEVAVGPIHAGVIEPGHFRFMCLGETVHHLEIHLGYQHRGVERLLLARDPRVLAPLVETIAGDASVAHAWAYADALEALAGLRAGPDVEASRALGLELERIAMHLAGLAGLATDIAFLQGAATYGRLRTTAINASMLVCGSRFGRGWVRPAALRAPVDAAKHAALRSALELLARDLAIVNAHFQSASTVLHRLRGVGTVTREQALEVGLVGMAARASGVVRDNRASLPGEPYTSRPIAPVVEQTGDCWARARVRIRELDASIAWLGALLDAHPALERAADPVGALAPDTLAISVCEGWRGEVVHALETDGASRLRAYRVQDPSLRNWMGLALAVRENDISDFPICNKSFDLSYCGNDL